MPKVPKMPKIEKIWRKIQGIRRKALIYFFTLLS